MFFANRRHVLTSVAASKHLRNFRQRRNPLDCRNYSFRTISMHMTAAMTRIRTLSLSLTESLMESM